MKKSIYFWLCGLILMGLMVRPAVAQSENDFTISMRRDFGYSSGAGRIQGLFTISAKGPDTLQRVAFLIDGKSIGEDSETPFKVQFNTDQYELGLHTISATGYTSDGRELASNDVVVTFAPSEEGWKIGAGLAGGVLGLVAVVMVLSFVVTMVSTRKKGAIPHGQPRNYGLKGGTICTKCGRPFAFHVLSLNMLLRKLDFCPHCNKWQFANRLPIDVLRKAESAELEWDKPSEAIQGLTEEEKLRKELDASRYQ